MWPKSSYKIIYDDGKPVDIYLFFGMWANTSLKSIVFTAQGRSYVIWLKKHYKYENDAFYEACEHLIKISGVISEDHDYDNPEDDPYYGLGDDLFYGD
jgi:hypothetical protein